MQDTCDQLSTTVDSSPFAALSGAALARPYDLKSG